MFILCGIIQAVFQAVMRSICEAKDLKLLPMWKIFLTYFIWPGFSANSGTRKVWVACSVERQSKFALKASVEVFKPRWENTKQTLEKFGRKLCEAFRYTRHFIYLFLTFHPVELTSLLFFGIESKTKKRAKEKERERERERERKVIMGRLPQKSENFVGLEPISQRSIVDLL